MPEFMAVDRTKVAEDEAVVEMESTKVMPIW